MLGKPGWLILCAWLLHGGERGRGERGEGCEEISGIDVCHIVGLMYLPVPVVYAGIMYFVSYVILTGRG